MVYQCTVTGGVFTVWSGSAFQCASREITLRNSDFGSIPLPAMICNDGKIIGHGILQHNNCFTSQLNVTLSEELVGRTVTCGIDDGRQLTTINNTVLTISTSKKSIIIINHEYFVR